MFQGPAESFIPPLTPMSVKDSDDRCDLGLRSPSEENQDSAPESLGSSSPHHHVLKHQLPPPRRATLKGASPFSRMMAPHSIQPTKATPQSSSIPRTVLYLSPKSSRHVSQATGSRAHLKIAGKERCCHPTFVRTFVGPTGSWASEAGVITSDVGIRQVTK